MNHARIINYRKHYARPLAAMLHNTMGHVCEIIDGLVGTLTLSTVSTSLSLWWVLQPCNGRTAPREDLN